MRPSPCLDFRRLRDRMTAKEYDMRIGGLGGVVAAAMVMIMPQPLVAADKGATTPEDMLAVTNEMWRLLCGVVNRQTADQAAERFNKLVQKSWQLNEALFEGDAQDVENLDARTYRIAEVYEEASYEFDSLCRSQCYGSKQLVSAFLTAMELGVFGDEEREKLTLTHVRLTPAAAAGEVARLRRMEKVDEDLLHELAKVQDAASACRAAGQIELLAKRMSEGRPAHRYGRMNFPEASRDEFQRVCDELEPILWQIRNEIVRIVALKGYDEESFDSFSDALDNMYENLSSTHGECFDNVFDTSFRLDLDDALHESITTNP